MLFARQLVTLGVRCTDTVLLWLSDADGRTCHACRTTFGSHQLHLQTRLVCTTDSDTWSRLMSCETRNTHFGLGHYGPRAEVVGATEPKVRLPVSQTTEVREILVNNCSVALSCPAIVSCAH